MGLSPVTSLDDMSYGYHGDHRYLVRSTIFLGAPPVTDWSGAPPTLLTFCSIGFADHITDYEGDTTIDGTIKHKYGSGTWNTSESYGIGCDGGAVCTWESRPIYFTIPGPSFTVNLEATHAIDFDSDDKPPGSSATWNSAD